MNPRRCDDESYIQFLLAAPRYFTCAEAARVQPVRPGQPAHDAFTRLLDRLDPDAATLWGEVEPLLTRAAGVLIIDDTTLDKPYAKQMDLVSRHWSGKHHAVVQGINLVTLLWTDGVSHLPCDCRIYHKDSDQKTKNDHFVDMMRAARERGFRPECVLFDGWYASLDNLKLLRTHGWHWLTRLKSNRRVSVAKRPCAVSELEIPPEGLTVHLKGYGEVRVFRTAAPDGGACAWATDDLTMGRERFEELAGRSWMIEEYHRGVKQYCGIERCQMQVGRKQRNHIGLAVRAFVRLTTYCLRRGVSWWAAKTEIVRESIRAYLKNPVITLSPNA